MPSDFRGADSDGEVSSELGSNEEEDDDNEEETGESSSEASNVSDGEGVGFSLNLIF